ncbi:MAG: TIGR01244 family sulfur transferase [Pseudomonadota bacterium]
MFKALVDGFYVAPQLRHDDFPAAAAAGIRTIINNRPDGEAADQLSHAAARDAAKSAGLAYHYLPVVNGQLTMETVQALRALMGEVEQPILAYCRSGTRSTFLWAFASAPDVDGETIVEAAASAGYDVSGIGDQLAAMRRR